MAGKSTELEDRRVLRTRRALREALVALILEQGWDGFSVQDVCDRADVGRSTFYTHFADKEELIAGGLRDLGQHLRAQLRAGGLAASPLGFARPLIEHAHEERRLFLTIVGRKGGHLVREKFRDLILELVREDLEPLLPAGPRRDATSAFLAGALVELLTWSLESRAAPQVEGLHGLYEALAQPALRAARQLERGPQADR